jgi:DNA-binding transcriptional regulator YdaS (Cro superfamily)
MINKPPPLRKFERATRLEFVGTIDTANDLGMDLRDKYVFQGLLATAVNFCGLQASDMARLLGFSKAAISRWISGDAAPHKQHRPAIIRTLRDAIERLANEPDGDDVATSGEEPDEDAAATPAKRAVA